MHDTSQKSLGIISLQNLPYPTKLDNISSNPYNPLHVPAKFVKLDRKQKWVDAMLKTVSIPKDK
jgi:hypothetical protein